MTEPRQSWTWRALDRSAAFSARFLLCAGALAAVLVVVVALQSLVLSLAFAFLFAAVLAPLTDRLVRRGVRRGLAAVLCAVLAVAFLAGVAILFISTVVADWKPITESASQGVTRLSDRLQDRPFSLSADQSRQADNLAHSTWDTVASGVKNGALHVISLTVSAVTATLLALVFMLYLLFDGGQSWRWLLARLPAGQSAAAGRVGDRSWAMLSGYMRGTLFVGLCDGAVIGLGLWLLDVPYAVPVGVLTVFAEFIPLFGATIMGALAVLLAYAHGGAGLALAALLVIIPVQQFNAHFVSPHIVGESIQLHPLVLMVSLIAATTLAGFMGAVLAAPVTAVLSIAAGELRAATLREPDATSGDVETPGAATAVGPSAL
jgi:predicted PurR-regulated permease PerM